MCSCICMLNVGVFVCVERALVKDGCDIHIHVLVYII